MTKTELERINKYKIVQSNILKELKLKYIRKSIKNEYLIMSAILARIQIVEDKIKKLEGLK